MSSHFKTAAILYLDVDFFVVFGKLLPQLIDQIDHPTT